MFYLFIAVCIVVIIQGFNLWKNSLRIKSLDAIVKGQEEDIKNLSRIYSAHKAYFQKDTVYDASLVQDICRPRYFTPTTYIDMHSKYHEDRVSDLWGRFNTHVKKTDALLRHLKLKYEPEKSSSVPAHFTKEGK
jgi:hypothetical protein